MLPSQIFFFEKIFLAENWQFPYPFDFYAAVSIWQKSLWDTLEQ